MLEWSKESAQVGYDAYLNGANYPQGLNAESAAVMLKVAFPEITKELDLNELVTILNAYVRLQYSILRQAGQE
jgi:hypothetical protein